MTEKDLVYHHTKVYASKWYCVSKNDNFWDLVFKVRYELGLIMTIDYVLWLNTLISNTFLNH